MVHIVYPAPPLPPPSSCLSTSLFSRVSWFRVDVRREQTINTYTRRHKTKYLTANINHKIQTTLIRIKKGSTKQNSSYDTNAACYIMLLFPKPDFPQWSLVPRSMYRHLHAHLKFFLVSRGTRFVLSIRSILQLIKDGVPLQVSTGMIHSNGKIILRLSGFYFLF